MFENITVGYLLASTMAIVGDILALLVLAGAGVALLGALLGASRRSLARPLSGSIGGIIIVSVGITAKFFSSELAGVPNGVFIGLSNVAIIAILLGSALLTMGAVTLIMLKRAAIG